MVDGFGKLLWEYEIGGGFLPSVSMSQDGALVAAPGWDNNVYALDGRGQFTADLRRHQEQPPERQQRRPIGPTRVGGAHALSVLLVGGCAFFFV